MDLREYSQATNQIVPNSHFSHYLYAVRTYTRTSLDTYICMYGMSDHEGVIVPALHAATLSSHTRGG